MADVAERAQVSIKTVSRVVNDEPGVRALTARRVRSVIDELGFHRNEGADVMHKSRPASIGLVVEDLTNPFYSHLSAAIEREARLHRHLLISTSAQMSAEREAELVEALVARRVEALIVVPIGPRPGEALTAAARDLPVVCVDRPQPGLAADTVLSDNEGGIRSAVEHLVAHRHQRIGFLGDDRSLWTAQRRNAAFLHAVEALGLPRPAHAAMGPYALGEVAETLERWSSGSSPVTALVTGNNRVTLAVLRAMRERHLALTLVGYDDFELADFLDPPITVVNQDPAALGERAVQLVFARLGGDRGPARTVVVPTRLIVRGSSRRTPGPDSRSGARRAPMTAAGPTSRRTLV